MLNQSLYQLATLPRTLRRTQFFGVARQNGPTITVLSAAIVFALGVGIVAWDYALAPVRPLNYLLFWLGMALCLLSGLAVGLRRRAGSGTHIAVLATLGAAIYLPYFLRSPARLLFQDELYHFQVLQFILELGHRDVPVTYYPIPGEFPGLEFATVGLIATSGLSALAAVRIVTLLAHMIIPTLAYLVCRGMRLPRRTAFVAALIYITNTSYYFFHAIFSYETFGILFFLSVWVLLARWRGLGVQRHDLWPALVLVFAVAITHHVSSYMLLVSVVIAWVGMCVLRRGTRLATGLVALVSVVFPVSAPPRGYSKCN